MSDDTDRDLGDGVPPGVAVKYPAPLTEHDKEVKRKLEDLGSGATPDQDTKNSPSNEQTDA
jgi:hypothetical protein